MQRKHKVLLYSWLNVAILTALIAAFSLAMAHNSDFLKNQPRTIAEYATMACLVYFVLIMPVTATMALVLNRKEPWRPAYWMNGIPLCFWLILFIAAIIGFITR